MVIRSKRGQVCHFKDLTPVEPLIRTFLEYSGRVWSESTSSDRNKPAFSRTNNIGKIKKCMPRHDAEIVVHSIAMSRVNNHNLCYSAFLSTSYKSFSISRTYSAADSCWQTLGVKLPKWMPRRNIQ